MAETRTLFEFTMGAVDLAAGLGPAPANVIIRIIGENTGALPNPASWHSTPKGLLA